MKYSKEVDTDISIEQSHGRHETRIVQTYNNIRNIDPNWIGVKTLIKVYRKTIKGKKETEDTSFYISSLSPKTPAKKFAEGIRFHWSIESFHWIKDVTFREDASKVKKGNAPENYSLLRNFIINVLRKNGLHKIQETLEKSANNLRFITSLL